MESVVDPPLVCLAEVRDHRIFSVHFSMEQTAACAIATTTANPTFLSGKTGGVLRSQLSEPVTEIPRPRFG